MRRNLITFVFLASQALAVPVFAQTPPQPQQGSSGIGAETSSKQEVKKDEAAILPSAEGHKSSAAPTMVRDCTKNPADCTEPVTPADKSTAAGVQSK